MSAEIDGDDGQDANAPIEGMPRLWRATDLKPTAQQRWLAKGRIIQAAINLLIGDEGIGKSLFWTWVVAAVTTGRARTEFGIPAREPAHVIIVCTEDDWTTVVRPRLEVAGADLDFVRVICTDEDGSGAPVFPRDLFLIAEADPAPALVVVDAWLDTVPPGLTVRDPQQARQALHPWKELATRTDAAVLLLCHTNRVSSANARDKYGATSELRKKTRISLMAQLDDDGRMVVGPEKLNAGKQIAAAAFAIEPVQLFDPTDDDDGTVPRLVYAGDSVHTARELLAETYAAQHDGDDNDAVAWLAKLLAGGPRWATDVDTAAELDHIKDGQRRAAKRKLRVESKKHTNGSWFWKLPEHGDRTPATGQDVKPAPSPDALTSSTSCQHLENQHVASTSEDVKMMNGEARDTARGLFAVDPPCFRCDKPVAGRTKDDRGRFAHITCQQMDIEAVR
ncbi:AAA family ATPase [Mycobacterium colombiense]